MASPPSDSAPMPVPAKVIITGGFGVGKTTLVGAISEIPPVATEASMTSMARDIDDHDRLAGKTTTTVAMDFGRITIDASLVLYLFGTPGQDRFGFMWDDLFQGALGAVALVDLRHVEDCFPALDYFEKHGLPYVVGINVFAGTPPHDLSEVRAALDVDPAVPVLYTDARSRQAVKELLLTLLQLLLARATAAPATIP